MTTKDLVPGKHYRMADGERAEFSRIGGTGLPIFHPPGEPDTQSSFALRTLDGVEEWPSDNRESSR